MKIRSIVLGVLMGAVGIPALADNFVYQQVREQTQDGQRFEFFVEDLPAAGGPMYFLLEGAGDFGGPTERLRWDLDNVFVGVEVGSFSSGAVGGPFLYLNLDGVWEFARYYQLSFEQTAAVLENRSFDLVVYLGPDVNSTPVSFISVELGYQVAPVPEIPTGLAFGVGLFTLGALLRRRNPAS